MPAHGQCRRRPASARCADSTSARAGTGVSTWSATWSPRSACWSERVGSRQGHRCRRRQCTCRPCSLPAKAPRRQRCSRCGPSSSWRCGSWRRGTVQRSRPSCRRARSPHHSRHRRSAAKSSSTPWQWWTRQESVSKSTGMFTLHFHSTPCPFVLPSVLTCHCFSMQVCGPGAALAWH